MKVNMKAEITFLYLILVYILFFLFKGLVKMDMDEFMQTLLCPEQDRLLVWQTVFRHFTTELINADAEGNTDDVSKLKSSLKVCIKIIKLVFQFHVMTSTINT